MESYETLIAQPRTATGKGAARRFRRDGYLPAVLYGRQRKPLAITVAIKEFKNLLFAGGGGRTLFNLRVEDHESPLETTVMLKDHQIDPVKRTLIHADFFEVEVDRPIEMEVPLVLTGKPEGVEKGGLLQQVRHTISLSALPQHLPDNIEVDVSHLDMGESLHVEDIQTSEGVTLLFDVNFTLATVIAPKGVKTEELEDVEGEDGEAAANSEETSGTA